MNRDIFLQVLMKVPNQKVAENLLMAYPEWVPEEDSMYWVHLFKNRFPQQKINLKQIYLNQISDRVIERLTMMQYYMLRIDLHRMQNHPDLLEFLFVHSSIGNKEYFEEQINKDPSYISIYGNGVNLQCEIFINHIGTRIHISQEDLIDFLKQVPPDLFEWLPETIED